MSHLWVGEGILIQLFFIRLGLDHGWKGGWPLKFWKPLAVMGNLYQFLHMAPQNVFFTVPL